MKIPFIVGVFGIVTACIAYQATNANSLLDTHTKKLQEAKAMGAQFTVQVMPGAAADYSLKLEKDGKFRFESPDELIIGNGTTVWTYKKADNTYSQASQTDDDIKKLMSRDALLAWSAFFVKEPFKDATNVKVGASRVIKGKTVTEVTATLSTKPEKTVTYFVDQDLGIARGLSITNGDKRTIVLAKDLSIASDSAADSDFTFTAPDGAKKVDPSAVAAGPAIAYATVATIFQSNCVGCHSGPGAKAGLDLSSYQGVMAGSRRGAVVTAGDPDSSSIMRNLKGTAKQMPPSGPLSAGDIQTISDWIKGGAKQS